MTALWWLRSIVIKKNMSVYTYVCMPFSIHCAIHIDTHTPLHGFVFFSLLCIGSHFFSLFLFYIFNWPPICIRCVMSFAVWTIGHRWFVQFTFLFLGTGHTAEAAATHKHMQHALIKQKKRTQFLAHHENVLGLQLHSCRCIQNRLQLVLFMQIMLNALYQLETIYRNNIFRYCVLCYVCARDMCIFIVRELCRSRRLAFVVHSATPNTFSRIFFIFLFTYTYPKYEEIVRLPSHRIDEAFAIPTYRVEKVRRAKHA